MKIPKKILNQINRLTFIEEAIKENHHNNPNFLDGPPETWQSDERELFDTLASLEDKIKSKVNEILNPEKK